ncbi:MAG TPA: glycerol kinase GlpK, partial [Gammaproteobacteria bacterium]|nr:glycerol kinase GlpK [Gammaproteobacteria bacterium]
AIVFDKAGNVVALAQREFPQIYPDSGWVEHDPEAIWSSTLAVCREAFVQAERQGATVVAIGITNQRETTLLWERASGKAVCNAIVWQDRRTAELCADLKARGHEPGVTRKTGLLLDPYFSATKLAWMLRNVFDAAARAARGELAFGTVDSFLMWRLTKGKVHATDATNASRTLLFNIHEQRWDDSLLALFDIPASLLPEVRDSAADYGLTDPEWFGRPLPILGVAGDQQAALIGQACFEPGMVKSTYGTGCFALLNTGTTAVASENRLLTTVAYRCNGQPVYALEGSIFVAGAAVQWLRDGIKIIRSATEVEPLAAGLDSNRGVYFVPAFTGLGAPHWDPNARGAIFGLTRDTGIADIVRAALESVCYQTHDLLAAMARDSATNPSTLRVDGGMSANDWLLQYLADIVGTSVDRPRITETTAVGAAHLAGLQAGIYGSFDDLKQHWHADQRFQPQLRKPERDLLLRNWEKAVSRVREHGG